MFSPVSYLLLGNRAHERPPEFFEAEAMNGPGEQIKMEIWMYTECALGIPIRSCFKSSYLHWKRICASTKI
jgi:hypothetical protein